MTENESILVEFSALLTKLGQKLDPTPEEMKLQSVFFRFITSLPPSQSYQLLNPPSSSPPMPTPSCLSPRSSCSQSPPNNPPSDTPYSIIDIDSCGYPTPWSDSPGSTKSQSIQHKDHCSGRSINVNEELSMEAGGISVHPIEQRLDNTYSRDFDWAEKSRIVDQHSQLSLQDAQSPDPPLPGSSTWLNQYKYLLPEAESETPQLQSNQPPFSPSPCQVEVSSLYPASCPHFDYPDDPLQPPLKHVSMKNIQNARKRSVTSHDEGCVPRVSKTRKRSITSYDNDGLPSRSELTARVPSKIPHSIIEAKYRTKINTKIETLRANVPFWALAAGEDEGGTAEDQSTSIDRRSKANVLENATQYILHLEKQTRRIGMEMQDLKDRIG